MAPLTSLASDTRYSFLQSLEVGHFVDVLDAGIWYVFHPSYHIISYGASSSAIYSHSRDHIL
jgi:hypothetical protein